MKSETRSALDCIEEVVLGKLKCQVARPFTRDRKSPDSSGTRTHNLWDTCPVL